MKHAILLFFICQFTKKRLLLNLLFGSFFFLSSAQVPMHDYIGTSPANISYEQMAETKFDTLYYPFYNGVQMIELRMEGYLENDRKHAYSSLIFPIYIFRREDGSIVSKFNTCGREIEFSKLLSPEQSREKSIKHKPKKLDIQRRNRQYVLRDWKGVYAFVKEKAGQESNPGWKSKEYLMGIMDSTGKEMVAPVCNEVGYVLPHNTKWIKVGGFPDGTEKKKFGIMEKDGDWLIPFEYDMIEYFDNYKNLFKASKDGNSFILDENGNILHQAAYDEITPYYYKEGWFNVKQDGKFGLCDENYRLIIPCNFTKPIGEIKDGFSNAYKEGGYGLIDDNGKELTEFKYNLSFYPLEKKYFLGRDMKFYYLIDSTGKEILKSIYNIEKIIDGKRFIARIGNTYQNGKCGIIGRDENILLPFDYYDIRHIKDDIFIAGIAGKLDGTYHFENSEWIAMNSAGEKLFDRKFKTISPVGKDYFIGAVDENNYSVYDWEGRMILKEYYRNVSAFGEKYFMIRDKDYRCYFVDTKGKKVTDTYANFSLLGHNLFRFNWGNEFYITDSTLQIIAQLDGEYDYKTIKGAYAYKEKGEWKLFVNKKRILEDIDFENIHTLQENFIIATINGKTGAMDFKQKSIIPFEYDGIHFVNGDYYIVTKNNLRGIYSLKDGLIVPCEYDYVDMKMNLFAVRKDGRYYWKDLTGKDIFPDEYEWITFLYDYSDSDKNAFVARKNGKIGVVSRSNEILLPFIFDHNEGFNHQSYFHFTEEYISKFQRTRRDSIEYWFIDIHGEVVNIITHPNRDKGFKTIHSNESDYRLHKYGITNWNGDTVLPFTYRQISNLENDHFLYRIDSLQGLDGNKKEDLKNYVVPKYGLLDTLGRVFIKAEYDEVKWHDRSYIKVKKDGLWGLFDSTGRLVCAPNYNGFGFDIKGIITFGYGGKSNSGGNGNRYEGGKVGVMTMTGTITVQPKYDYIWCMDERKFLLVVSRDNSIGIIDLNGSLKGEFVKNVTPKARWEEYLKNGE